MIHIWYFICFSFLLSNINILFEESYEVVYRTSLENQNNSIQYLNCVNLSEILINKTIINLNEIENDLNFSLRWIQKNMKDKYGDLIANDKIERILDRIKLKNHFIYRNRICFIFNDLIDFEPFSKLLDEFLVGLIYLLDGSEITDSYIMHKLLIIRIHFFFNNKTFSFLKFKNQLLMFGVIDSSFYQISIYHQAYPYSSCSKDYSNFRCLNDKIKSKQKLSKYYYRSDENVSIELNYQIDQTIIDNEIKIIKQCNRIDCNINLLYLTIFYYIEPESIILKSFLIITNLDFYLQLIGLIVLFLNIPIYSLIIKVNNSINLKPLKIKLLRLKFIKLKLKKFKKIFEKLNLKLNRFKFFKLLKRKCLKINYLIILILLICLVILFSRSIYNFIEERDYPFMKTISVDSNKPELSIIICASLYWIKGDDYNIYNKSLSELEKESDSLLNIVLKDIYLEFLNKKISTKWQLELKSVIFKSLKSCFQLKILLDQPKYQTIFSVTKLIIELNKIEYTEIYILTDNEIFNSRSYFNDPVYNFRKRTLERSKLNKIKKCKYYNQINDNCESKWNCIDQCKTKEIYKKFKNLTIYSIIDKNHFKDEEWSKLFIKPHSDYDFEIYLNLSKECIDKYSKLDPCVEIKFERQSKIDHKDDNKRLDNKIEIDLNYEVIYYEEDEPSILKLLLDLLNIQGNLFGLNFYNFLLIVLGLFRLNLKLIKIIRLLIYLICLIGFIFHLWSIYDEIINIEIIFSEHYELIKSIQTPDLIFCYDFNHTELIDQNYKLTYQYLDKITSNELNINKIFSRIEYLNIENRWIKLDNRTDFKDNNLEIKIFYYLDRKCFTIIQSIEYSSNQFEFSDKVGDDLILKILFNRTHLDNKFFYFFTKSKNRIHFSKILELNLKSYYKSFKSFNIKHELIARDEFELIKNPLSNGDDQNDLDKFFTKLINYLDTKLNLVTFNLPINKTDSNLNKELDDNLFIQLYNQKQDQNNSNTNHLRQHSNNYLEISEKYLDSSPDFEFSLSFYRKVIAVSNKISLIKLIIDLLNVLSFWFNLGILDLHHYFSIFQLLPLQLYKLLIVIKNKSLSFII